jgi:hypothetical protein
MTPSSRERATRNDNDKDDFICAVPPNSAWTGYGRPLAGDLACLLE